MYNFDSQTLSAFLSENKNFFEGARIQKIQQPTRREFVFSLRNNGETRKFYININPNCYHLCFMTSEGEENRHIEIPQKPPMFCMLLRKYLESAKISHVAQPPFERIFELYIEAFNELKEKIYLVLAVELMGKHSNVVLYSHDTNVIIGCAHNVGSEKSREREMAGTLPYVYPSQGKIVKDFSEIKTFYSEILGNSENVNEIIDAYYSEIQKSDKIKSLKTKFTTIISHKLKKVKNSLDKMQKQLEKEKIGEKYKNYGDLIMTNLYAGKDFEKEIEVYDFDGNLIKIDLDETKNLSDNAQRYYKLYKKSKTSREKLAELTEELREQKGYLEGVLFTIDNADKISDLLEIGQEIEPEEQKKIEKPRVEELLFGEYSVWIGKNNRQNDFLVSKLSRENDMWFHVKDCTGSHVLLRGEKFTDEIIFECAKLAKQNSTAKDSLKAPVIYTLRKYLKKPPKANLGYVTFSHEKEIMV